MEALPAGTEEPLEERAEALVGTPLGKGAQPEVVEAPPEKGALPEQVEAVLARAAPAH